MGSSINALFKREEVNGTILKGVSYTMLATHSKIYDKPQNLCDKSRKRVSTVKDTSSNFRDLCATEREWHLKQHCEIIFKKKEIWDYFNKTEIWDYFN